MPKRNIYDIPRYIAHRGLHGSCGGMSPVIAENTLPAFEKAIEHGFAIELDVRFTADRRMVVFHDKNLMRICGCNIELNRLTYEELRKHTIPCTGEFDPRQLGQIPGADTKGEAHIPLLSEVLKLVNGRVFLLIELKDCPEVPDAEKRLAHMLRQYRGEYAVQSFDPRSLMKLRLTAPEIMRGQLVSLTGSGSRRLAKEIAASMPVWKGISKPDFLSWDLKSVSIDSAFSAAELGAKLLTWTADSEELISTAETFSDAVIFENIPLKYFTDI